MFNCPSVPDTKLDNQFELVNGCETLPAWAAATFTIFEVLASMLVLCWWRRGRSPAGINVGVGGKIFSRIELK